MTLANHEEYEVGTVGTIASRWIGTIYAVKLPNGEFHWLDSSEIGTTDPTRHRLSVGDIAIITSDKHQYQMAKKGDLVQIIKIIEDADYYGVIINGELHWLAGFELAGYR